MQLWSQVHKSLQRIRERKLANFIPWGPASIQVSTRDIFWFVAFWAAWQFLFQQKHHIICPPSGGSIAHVPLRLLVPQSVRPYARQSHLHQQVLALFCLQLRYSDIMVDLSEVWKLLIFYTSSIVTLPLQPVWESPQRLRQTEEEGGLHWSVPKIPNVPGISVVFRMML